MSRVLSSLMLGIALTACGGGNDGGGPAPVPVSPTEIRANVVTAGDQQRPRVARNARGDALAVWESFGQDGNHFGIYARRFADGEPVGSEFRVNTTTAGRQNFAAVAIDGNGNSVVVWRSSLQDGPGGTIYGQRFDAAGARLGGEFQIGPSSSNFDSQSEPRVAMNADGRFVVVWSNREITQLAILLGRNDIEQRMIQARIYGADGSPRTGVLDVVGPTTTAIVRAPDVGIDAQGRFVVSWISAGNPSGIRVRSFDAEGIATSGDTGVDTPRNESAPDFPAIAMGSDGRFVVGWEAFTFGYQPLGVFGRLYEGADADRAVGGERQFTGPDSGLLERISLSMNATGSFALAGSGFDGVAVAGFNALGQRIGLSAVSNPDFAAVFGAVALADDGRVSVVWNSFGQDGDGRGVYLREATVN